VVVLLQDRDFTGTSGGQNGSGLNRL
jgi:hypothetical protein